MSTARCNALSLFLLFAAFVGLTEAIAIAQNHRTPTELFRRGEKLYEAHDYLHAAQEFRAATRAKPALAEAYYYLGASLFTGAGADSSGHIRFPPGTALAFQTYLALAPDGPYAAIANNMLRALGAPASSPEAQEVAARVQQQQQQLEEQVQAKQNQQNQQAEEAAQQQEQALEREGAGEQEEKEKKKKIADLQNDVNAILQNAVRQKVVLSKQEITTILTAHFSNMDRPFSGAFNRQSIYPGLFPVSPKELRESIAHCNNNKWREEIPHDHLLLTGADNISADAGSECAYLGVLLINAVGLGDPEGELALQRACALPEVRTNGFVTIYTGNLCSMLGDLYRARGQMDMALAVYEHAPNCNIDEGRLKNVPNPPLQLLEACRQGAVEVFKARNDLGDERALLGSLCAEYSDNFSNDCQRYQQLGGSVDMNAVHARNDAYQAQVSAQSQQANAAWEEAQQQGDAHFNAVMVALRSLPGGNDPNAIQHAAQQQEAQIEAIGAANDAVRQQASGTVAIQSSSPTVQPPPPVVPSMGNGLPPSPNAVPTTDSNESGSSTSGGQGGSPGSSEPACTDMTASATVKVTTLIGPGHCPGEAAAYITNHSSNTLWCEAGFFKGGSIDKGGIGGTTVRSGQTIGGEGGGLWECGADVPARAAFYCYPNQEHGTCRENVEW